MKSGWTWMLVLAGLAVVVGRPVRSQELSARGVVRPGRLLVGFKKNVSSQSAQRLLAAASGVASEALPQLSTHLLRISAVGQEEAAVSFLRRQPEVAFAEVDRLVPPSAVPNDPMYSQQWHLPNISGPDAWNLSTGSTGVTVAILDTGVEATHPDLASRLVPGWNFYDGNSSTGDVFGHGTMVAGVAAAAGNNKTGVAGVAWGARIMPCRVSDPNGYASLSAVASALTWAADHGARVAKISYAVSDSAAVSSAAQYFQSKGGVVTVAAGNNATNDTTADNPYVVTVSAIDATNSLASWSNTGNNVDLTAPGDGIITTQVGGSYGSYSGTSFSAPVVAGVAALVFSANANLTGAQARSLLLKSGDDLGAAGWDPKYGWGRINAYKAVIAALGPDTVAPSVSISSPAAGSVVSGKVSVQVSASDNIAVASVSLAVDGKPSTTALSAAPYTFTWDATTATPGSHTLQATATDLAGNQGKSAVVTVSVPDVTAPTVSITSPVASAAVSGTVTVTVAASDNVGVASVSLLIDGKAGGAPVTGSAYSFTWDTSTVAPGTHTLQAVASDGAGNKGTSAAVSVTVKDVTPPAVAILSPVTGSTVSGTVAVQVSATDNVGVSAVTLLVDGKSSATASAATTFSLNTTSLAPGLHTLQATAGDAAGNKGSSTVVSVKVADVTAPSVTISASGGTSKSPSKSAVASTVTVSATDNVAVVRLEIWVDGTLSVQTTTAPFTLSLAASALSPGNHTVVGKAYDAAGNVGTSAAVSVTGSGATAKNR